MAEPDDEVQSWFSGLSFKLKREIATKIKEEADGLASEIKAAAPRKTGTLAESVKVRRKRNELELEVTAGGETTTDKTGGHQYDYALANEFGTTKMPAQPFFWNTYRERAAEIRQNIEDAVSEVLDKA